MKKWVITAMLMLLCCVQSIQARAEEQEMGQSRAINAGAADMRVGKAAGAGFITSLGTSADIYYSAKWSGSDLSSSDAALNKGQITYCIEPDISLIGVAGDQASGYIGSKETLMNWTTSRITSEGTVMSMLGRVLSLCGPTISDGPSICNQEAEASRYIATQLIIWQIVYGDMDENFNLLGSTWKKKGLEGMQYWNSAPSGGKSVKAWHDEWLALLQLSVKLPSFAENASFAMDGKTATLTDTYGVLPYVNLTASDPSVSLSVSGNQLQIENPQNVDFTIQICNMLCQNAKEPIPIMAYDTTDTSNLTNHRQTTIISSFTPLNDPVEGSMQIQALRTLIQIHKLNEMDTGELPGAKLQILDEEGEVVAEWTTGSEPYYIEKLPVGHYVLHEVSAPAGYVTAADIPFEVLSTGEIQIVQMEDDVTKLQIRKTDLTGGEEIEGAHLQIWNAENEIVAEWISGAEPYYIEKLPVGTYTLHEELAPAGYATAEDIVFTINDTGEIQKVQMKDDVIKLEISKKDMTTGKELPGAALQILDADGTIVEEWISGDAPHYMEKLPAGTYTLHEESAPLGYVLAEDIVFTVLDTDKLQSVEMLNDITRLEIHKIDKSSGKELKGALLQIFNQQGEIIQEWLSSERALYLEGIPAGEYILHEELAPEGYAQAEDIAFQIGEGDETVRIEMKDEPLRAAQPESPAVNTGDAGGMFWYGAILAAAAALVLLAGLLHRNRQQENRK